MNKKAELLLELSKYDRLAIAVSGGVDSLTLAHCAHEIIPYCKIIHAVSPAVPQEATMRVQRHSKENNWNLEIIKTGEFDDENYRANPHNRCYFCKTNLYASIAKYFNGPIASGANLDDLGDYRPGLVAAKEHEIVHPFIDAHISKGDLRIIAAALGLNDIANLPAQPCLASRVTTGIKIDEADLTFIEQMEAKLRTKTPIIDIRCRITKKGVVLETSQPLNNDLLHQAALFCQINDRVFLENKDYRRGSAFILHEKGGYTKTINC